MATYRVELRLDGVLIGDVRELAQNLSWTKRRIRKGVDSIDFTINDVKFAEWLEMRDYTINDVLKPIALDCRIVRDGVAVVGGFLATMPGYSPNGTSANLQLKFDGYFNLLAGVNLYPAPAVKEKMSQLIVDWITLAEERATNAGKGFGFTAGIITELAEVQHTVENYKSIKDAIADRCDNVTGAGPFDMNFNPDRSYDVFPESEYGDVITDYVIQYPSKINGVSATSISANEVSGFASSIIGLGGGEVSEDAEEDTVIVSMATNNEAVQTYGYAEAIYQASNVTKQETLDTNTVKQLAKASAIQWQPQVNLLGVQVAPIPSGGRKIWIGDTVQVNNTEDPTGMTSGQFRVMELAIKVSATNAETITPTLSRGDSAGGTTFTDTILDIKRELLALKTAYRAPTGNTSE